MSYRFRQSEDLHWLAGLIEGEGSFIVCPRGKYGNYPCIQIGMTDADVIERVVALVPEGTLRVEHNVRNGHECKPLYRWRLQRTAPALALAESLRPLMGTRRTQQLDHMVEQVGAR